MKAIERSSMSIEAFSPRSVREHGMASFLIESSQDEAALELSSSDVVYFLATLRSRGVRGTARVGTFMSQGLAELFAHFANNWKGWEGSKDWASLEGELSISARADSLGHIFMNVRLRDGAPAKWTLQAELILEAGALPMLANRARDFETAVVRIE
jgi:hypothetical protein